MVFDSKLAVSRAFWMGSVESWASMQPIVFASFGDPHTTLWRRSYLNADDDGNRKFIMVQLPEPCPADSEAAKAGYVNICEIGKERIRRAGEKIKDEVGLTAQNLDIGFRVLKLDSTNMRDVYYAAGEYTQAMLPMMEDNIKDDRTDMDLLYACLLDWGLSLSMPHTQEKIDGFTVHTYNDGDLIACFDTHISDAVVKEIARRCGSPERQGLATRANQVRKELTDEWDNRGVSQGMEYATLTDEITRAWSGMTSRQYKHLKGLKKENLRDNMSTLELVLNMLAEATTTEISKSTEPQTFDENKRVAQRGGRIAGNARREIEADTGKSVITAKTAIDFSRLIADVLECATNDEDDGRKPE
ncbi:MAG: adenine-specific DNA-methyltransferase [Bacillota bacterium]|nr:MAG: adenine-specific DNA-methyltransferase [Bacillota bacterium]